MSRVRPGCAALFIVAVLAAPGSAFSLAAQQDTVVVGVPTAPQPAQEDFELPSLDEPATPGGTFLRALLLPGWGHASIGAYTRGGFYLVAESTTGFLLARTLRRLALAKDARDLREDRVRALLLASGTHPDSVAAQVSLNPDVRRSRRLVDSRRQQVEDWLALGVFMVFLSGADAFVSAHLLDFPEPIAVQAGIAPTRSGAAVQLGLSLAVGPPFRDR